MIRILLVGMMGSGKTTVGALLAERLGGTFVDSDAAVEARTGRTVRELFEDGGEAGFRLEETAVLREALDRAPTGPEVISVAGGAVLDPQNRALLEDAGSVVWLRASPDTLARRVGAGEGRPLLGADPRADLVALDARRRPFYEEVACLIIDVDGLDPESVADLVLAGLDSNG